MKEKDREKFVELMYMLARGYRKEMDKETIALYWTMLKDMDIKTISERVYYHLKNEKFFPAICEIRIDPKPQKYISLEEKYGD